MEKLHKCSVCHKNFRSKEIINADIIREEISDLIQKDTIDWNESSKICRNDLRFYKNKYLQTLLKSKKGDLNRLENEVLSTIEQHELISINSDLPEQKWSRGEIVADKITNFGGSWKFIGFFMGFLIVWIIINSMVAFWQPVDPYPFILLNLLLSCLAAIQAPIIMMSQNRQEAKDRMRSQYDYQVNLKAELEIRQLHEKIDHLLSHQGEKFSQIQKTQADLIEELKQIKNS